jgi:6-phosphogluconolactonase
VHRVRGELEPAAAAAAYDAELRGERLNLILLGIGPDGHTASLFPHAPSLRERDRLAVDAEAGLEPFVPRVTLTLPAIASADLVVFLVTGAGKAEAVRHAFAEPPSETTPASLARGRRTVAILDRAAASAL